MAFTMSSKIRRSPQLFTRLLLHLARKSLMESQRPNTSRSLQVYLTTLGKCSRTSKPELVYVKFFIYLFTRQIKCLTGTMVLGQIWATLDWMGYCMQLAIWQGWKTGVHHNNRDGKVRFGPVLLGIFVNWELDHRSGSQILPNLGPDCWFGSKQSSSGSQRVWTMNRT